MHHDRDTPGPGRNADSVQVTRASLPPLVSVIIPTYNRAILILRALASVHDQTYRPIEVLVVDDGSTDGTSRAIEGYSTSQEEPGCFTIRYVWQQNRGVSAARNLGLRLSSGAFIQYLDADDYLYPQKLAVHMSALLKDPTLDYVYSPAEAWGANGHRKVLGRPIPFGAERAWSTRPNWVTMGPLYRRRACMRVGPWDEDLRVAEDLVYHARVLLARLKGLYMPGVCAAIPFHSGPRLTMNSFEMACCRELAAMRMLEAMQGAGVREARSIAGALIHLMCAGVALREHGDLNGWCRCRDRTRAIARESGSALLQVLGWVPVGLCPMVYRGLLGSVRTTSRLRAMLRHLFYTMRMDGA